MIYSTINANFNAGAGSCPVTYLSRTALIAEESAGNLVEGCFYCANDINWISAGGVGSFYAVALAPNRLSESGYYEGSFNTGNPYESEITWADGQVRKIFDHVRGNEVVGAGATQIFPFGNANVFGNRVSNARFVYSAGVFTQNDVVGDHGVSIIFQSGGTVSRNAFSNCGVTNFSGGTFTDNSVVSKGTVTQSGGNTSGCHISGASSLINSGATFSNNSLDGGSVVTVTSGSSSNNKFDTASRFTQSSPNGTITSSSVSGASLVETSIPIRYSSFDNGCNVTANLVQSGSLSRVRANYAIFSMNSASNVNITSLDSDVNTAIYLSPGASITASSTKLTDGGRILCSSGSTITVTYSNISSLSYTQTAVNSNLTVDRLNLTGNSYVSSYGTGNSVTYSTVANSSGVTFNSGCNNNSVVRCNARGLSYFIFLAGSGSSAMRNCVGDNGSTYTIQSSNSAVMESCSASSSTFLILSCASGALIRSCSCLSRSTISLRNNSGANSRLDSCNADGMSILTLENCPLANSVLESSSVTANYYLYATLTTGITRRYLHGYGRLTNSIANPPNGTFVDNF